MRPVFLILCCCLLPVGARAQVIVHQAALDQLAGLAPARPVAVLDVPVVRPLIRHHPRLPRVVAMRPVMPSLPVTSVRAVPVMAKPAAVAVAKPAQVPPAVLKPAPPPSLAPVVLGFAPGGAVLPAGSAAALQPICKIAGTDGIVAIDAHAPADPGDPSAAMRLSLSRAFAVRDALTACGIPAVHIIPRADGALGGDPATARISLGQGARP